MMQRVTSRRLRRRHENAQFYEFFRRATNRWRTHAYLRDAARDHHALRRVPQR